MKTLQRSITTVIFLISLSMTTIIISCNKNDELPKPTGDQIIYELDAVGGSGISGTATFEKLDDLSVRITIDLSGTTAGKSHPSHIHMNSAAEGGGIKIDLTNIDGATGESQTIVTEMKDGTGVTYESLIEFDGYINVHNSADDLGTLLAQGDIGSNKLTGESAQYPMTPSNDSGVSGTATFYQRLSGETLVVIDLEGDASDSNHPSHIHMGSTSSPGGIVIDLTNVRDGFSRTNISAFKDGTAVTYTELKSYAGYINVHNTPEDLGTLVAQGNIGSSAGEVEETIAYTVTNSGMTAYSFNGGGLSGASNPDLTLKRGNTYTFTVNAPDHPFYINSTQGTGSGNAYNTGVTNNGASNGTITFTVPMDAPGTLFYNCEFHDMMTGTITITD